MWSLVVNVCFIFIIQHITLLIDILYYKDKIFDYFFIGYWIQFINSPTKKYILYIYLFLRFF